MKEKRNTLKKYVTGTVAAACILGMLGPGTVWAKGPGPGGPGPGGPGVNLDALLPGQHFLKHGGKEYLFQGGKFFLHGPGGNHPVGAPPFGLIVPGLPRGFETLVVAGMTYFVLNGIYYQKAPSGYVVVERPAQAPPAPAMASTGTVMVTASTLNVRSGPATTNPVVAQVYSGQQLAVVGSAPGWYYIQLPDGRAGWVMDRYTSGVASPAQG